ncbi:hypothetical protein BGW36DRAFT_363502 [Talaromyces proteolyticus]|uniref:Transmembrane protein 135 N-terminal domain-containing protein n=1 Tax=Talaromyces proteolyticus TaxID=1131652 RepID=A0AAD4KII3_9EURO|nr:uncharacterized protein BGW36DRAFT_363502 [Talaromyces proteolyticus]KAH8691158.1 hypothetical protein BGW36DRAFT_363502 [Talaromyces proteolyticus]
MSPTEYEHSVHPIIQNALRVSLSAKEYKFLHERITKRSAAVERALPTPAKYEAIIHTKNKYNIAAVRASLRVFLTLSGGLSLAELVGAKIKKEGSKEKTRTALIKSPNFRLALSFSLLLLVHRVLYRFFVRLRANLRTEDAKPFRDRNPRISQALTSRYAPVVGASLAGLALGICPAGRIRITIAIYTATRSLEFLYNALDEKGYLEKKPWWFGSWLLMPISCAQLFHAFVFDRETIPGYFGSLILKFSPSYIPGPPERFPDSLQWPDKNNIVDSLGSIADLKWPAFISPILHPNNPNPLPAKLQSISPITSPAHPGIASLSCALLHPATPSCSTAFLHHLLNSVPAIVRTMTIALLAYSAASYKKVLANPITTTNLASKRILSLTAILSTSFGSLWASICLLNSLLPKSTLPTKRFFISGAIAGLPYAFVSQGRLIFTNIFRSAVYSAWATGVKRGLWREWKGGELGLVVLSWALIGAVLESSPQAVQGAGIRKALLWLRGDGFADPSRKKRAKEKDDEVQQDSTTL